MSKKSTWLLIGLTLSAIKSGVCKFHMKLDGSSHCAFRGLKLNLYNMIKPAYYYVNSFRYIWVRAARGHSTNLLITFVRWYFFPFPGFRSTENPTNVYVTLGDHDRGSESEVVDEVIPVSKVIVHPQYNPTVFYNDIALLKLSKKVIFKSSIQPVCWPNALPYTGKTVSESGQRTYTW